MKRLLFLLVLCCAAVACEKFEIPDIEIDREITRSDMNGYYLQVEDKYIHYENGKPTEFIKMPSTVFLSVDTYTYLAIDDIYVTPYLYTKCISPKIEQSFVENKCENPIDLENYKMYSGMSSTTMYDILKLTNDSIILIEPMQMSIERCKDDKNLNRHYKAFARTSLSTDLLKSFENAKPMSEYLNFWHNILSNTNNNQ